MDRIVPSAQPGYGNAQVGMDEREHFVKKEKLESRLQRFRPPPLEIREVQDQRVPDLPNSYDFNHGTRSLRTTHQILTRAEFAPHP